MSTIVVAHWVHRQHCLCLVPILGTQATLSVSCSHTGYTGNTVCVLFPYWVHRQHCLCLVPILGTQATLSVSCSHTGYTGNTVCVLFPYWVHRQHCLCLVPILRSGIGNDINFPHLFGPCGNQGSRNSALYLGFWSNLLFSGLRSQGGSQLGSQGV